MTGSSDFPKFSFIGMVWRDRLAAGFTPTAHRPYRQGMNRLPPKLRALLLAGALSMASSASLGQSVGIVEDSGTSGQVDVRPPDPGDPTPPNSAVMYILLFVLIGASIGLAILPSKRTHQD